MANAKDDVIIENLLSLPRDEQWAVCERRLTACVGACQGIPTEMLEFWAEIKRGDGEVNNES